MDPRLQQLLQAENTQAQLIGTTFIERRSTQHHQLIRILPEDVQSPAVSSILLNSMHLPLVRVTTKAVGVDLAPISVRHHDGTVRPTSRRPDHIRRGIRRQLLVDNNRDPRSLVKLPRVVRDAVVDRVVDAVRARVANGELVHEDPLVDGFDLGHDRHAGASEVFVVADVVDDRAPVAQVLGPLMGELLAVLGVPLVRVVDDQLVLVLEQEGLPDGVGAVGGVGPAARGDVADELPCARLIGARVQVDARAVVAPAVAGRENGARLEPAQRLLKLHQRRLRAHAPAVHLVGDVGDPFPGDAVVFALEDGEGGVVAAEEVAAHDGGRDEESAIPELDVTGVGGALAGGRVVDDVWAEGGDRGGRVWFAPAS